jgi:valyl-tRNA synthetase
MSKTLGNVIDPLDTIKEFGTDALRFTVALGTAGQVPFTVFKIWVIILSNEEVDCIIEDNDVIFFSFFQDLNLSTERLTSNKAFTNKLWNAGKFVLQNLPKENDISAWENILTYKVRSNLSIHEINWSFFLFFE